MDDENLQSAGEVANVILERASESALVADITVADDDFAQRELGQLAEREGASPGNPVRAKDDELRELRERLVGNHQGLRVVWVDGDSTTTNRYVEVQIYAADS